MLTVVVGRVEITTLNKVIAKAHTWTSMDPQGVGRYLRGIQSDFDATICFPLVIQPRNCVQRSFQSAGRSVSFISVPSVLE